MKEYNISYSKTVAILVAERKKRNITQEELRRKTKIGYNTFIKLEGDIEYTNWNALHQYAKALNFQISVNLLGVDTK